MSQPLHLVEAHLPQDVEAVRALFLEYASGLGFSICFQNFDAEWAALPGAYAPPGGAMLLAVNGANSAGCVALRPLPCKDLDVRRAGLERACEMKRLYVRPAYRGLGLGRRLAEACIDRARAAGYTRMVLDTVVSMAEANGLYPALGFVERPPYYHNPLPDVRYMELQL